METPLEEVLASFSKERMIEHLNLHPKDFKEAILLACSDKQPFSWRAAWVLGIITEKKDKRIKPHLNKLISSIKKKEDGHQRELLKIIEKMELTEDQEGLLFDICEQIWKDIYKQPSVRSTALKIILKIAKKYPELNNEINLLAGKNYLNTLSPGIKHSVSIMINDKNEESE